MNIKRIASALGAEISVIDLAGSMFAQQAFEIRQVFLNAWR
jgi:hypothetical protein